MEKVKNAIINAAGKGERLKPVTLEIPKPLVKVNGKRMIDTEIEALHYNGIYDIKIVVGYLKDQFEVLEKEYTGVEIIENPYCDTCNNISSLYCARDYIGDTLILDGDLLIYNKDILHSEFDRSGYLCIKREEKNNEWILNTDNNGIVTDCTVGGDGMWQLYGVSRWTMEDGKKLKQFLELEFEQNKNNQLFWDEVALYKHKNDFKLRVFEINKNDIVEIDNFSELVALDESYKRFIK